MMQMQASTALLKQLAALLDAGTLRTTVSKTFALAQAADAWRESRGGRTRGKIVLEVG